MGVFAGGLDFQFASSIKAMMVHSDEGTKFYSPLRFQPVSKTINRERVETRRHGRGRTPRTCAVVCRSIGDDARDRLGRTTRALVCGDREQAVDQPRWLPGSRETCARFVNGFVDETQWPANRRAQDVRRLTVRERLTPRDDVFLPGMPWRGQCDGGDRGDVAGVDERNPPSPEEE